MGRCKKDITPLVMHWILVYLALSYQFSSDHCEKYKNDPRKAIYAPVWMNYGMMHAQTGSAYPVFMCNHV